MGRSILKVKHPDREEYRYFVWSSVVDAPLTYGLSRVALEAFWITEAVATARVELRQALGRVEQCGTSHPFAGSPWEPLRHNRVGKGDRPLPVDELIRRYWDDPHSREEKDDAGV